MERGLDDEDDGEASIEKASYAGRRPALLEGRFVFTLEPSVCCCVDFVGADEFQRSANESAMMV